MFSIRFGLLLLGLFMLPLQNGYALVEDDADDEVIATEESFIKEVMSKFDEQGLDAMDMLDVNMDKSVSLNEVGLLDKNNCPYCQEEMIRCLEEKNELFSEADENKDNRLDEVEVKTFEKSLTLCMAKKKFYQMDRNHDGVYNSKDFPTIEESKAMMEENMKKLDEVIKKLENNEQNMDAGNIAQNFIQGMVVARADENYYQMDKDQDDCVSKADFIKYNLELQKITEEDEKFWLSEEDFDMMYDDISKAKEDCLSKEEYKDYNLKSVDF